jgi:hypothetical protein
MEKLLLLLQNPNILHCSCTRLERQYQQHWQDMQLLSSYPGSKGVFALQILNLHSQRCSCSLPAR